MTPSVQAGGRSGHSIDSPGDAVAVLRHVSKRYGEGETAVHALRDVNLYLPRGELIVFLGPSGSGKTTLLNVVGGIEAATAGDVLVDGVRLDGLDAAGLTEYRRSKVGFVFQFFNLIPTLTALENVEFASRLVPGSFKPEEILDAVGLGPRMQHFPSELSGGEQQRVAIARAIVRRPCILLCDEPTGELDYETGKKVLQLLEWLNRKEGITILLVTHNSAIAGMAHHVVRMHSGQIADVTRNDTPVAAAELRW